MFVKILATALVVRGIILTEPPEKESRMPLPPSLPRIMPLDAVWQPIAGTESYVYSAYAELRTVAAVRIIAVTKTRGADKLFCYIWLRDSRTIVTNARVQVIRDNWNLNYTASFVLCPLRKAGVESKETIGAAVAVVASLALDRTPSNLLKVRTTRPKKGIEENVHVCVKPFHFSWSRDNWLIEWLEINQLLGVSHFYIYNHSMSVDAGNNFFMYNKSRSSSPGCVLEHYQKPEGLLTILPWALPVASTPETRFQGLLAALNDCLYRSMATANWLLVLDLDELVLPRKENTALEMLNSLSAIYKQLGKKPAAFIFRNAFFYLKWEDDDSTASPLLTARKTRRWAVPHLIRNRSKYAVQPFRASELGINYVRKNIAGTINAGVHTERALLHNYKENCEYGGDQCLTVPSTVDRTAHKWADSLLERVRDRKRVLAVSCPQQFTECINVSKLLFLKRCF